MRNIAYIIILIAAIYLGVTVFLPIILIAFIGIVAYNTYVNYKNKNIKSDYNQNRHIRENNPDIIDVEFSSREIDNDDK